MITVICHMNINAFLAEPFIAINAIFNCFIRIMRLHFFAGLK